MARHLWINLSVSKVTSEDKMQSKHQIVLGSILTIIGGLGIILAPLFKLTELVNPWSFIAGFLAGLAGGLGVSLSISGLISYRKRPSDK